MIAHWGRSANLRLIQLNRELKMQYEEYKVEDFLFDEFFVRWVKKPSPETEHFWKSWIEKNPDKIQMLTEAKKIIQSVKYKNYRSPSKKEYNEVLENILKGVNEIAGEIPVVFPVHPRTEKRLREFDLGGLTRTLKILPPQPYLDMIRMMACSRLVLTDSGGMQEETTVLEKPCITMRDTTERPITLEKGSNVLVGSDPEKIRSEAARILDEANRQVEIPELWDGHAAERIVEILARFEDAKHGDVS